MLILCTAAGDAPANPADATADDDAAANAAAAACCHSSGPGRDGLVCRVCQLSPVFHSLIKSAAEENQIPVKKHLAVRHQSALVG